MRKFLKIYSRLKTNFYIRWNRYYFSLSGVKYGSNMKVRNRIYVKNSFGGRVVIGNNFTYSSGDNINSVSRNICGSIHVMNDAASLVIGDNCGISAGCIRAMESIRIGNNVIIGADCLIMDNDAHPINYIQRRMEFEKNIPRSEYLQYISKSPIVIADDVWIGARCQILKGVHIGERSIIAAGSIVTRDIPADCVAGGIPAKIIKRI